MQNIVGTFQWFLNNAKNVETFSIKTMLNAFSNCRKHGSVKCHIEEISSNTNFIKNRLLNQSLISNAILFNHILPSCLFFILNKHSMWTQDLILDPPPPMKIKLLIPYIDCLITKIRTFRPKAHDLSNYVKRFYIFNRHYEWKFP